VDKKRTAFLTILTALTFTWISFTTIAEAKNMEKSQSLDARQQAIVPIAAFTANGDLAKLKPALVEGLDAGLTVNEIKDILVQMYAYAGFPRSLNGIHAFMALLEERQARGIEDEVGKDAGPVPEDFNRDAYGAKVRAKLAGQKEIPPPGGYQVFTPVIDTYLKEHLFADIFVRDVLTHQERELVTIAALAAMPGTEGQLRFHLGATTNTGWTEAQLKDFICVLDVKVGKDAAERTREVLNGMLDGK
jgi:alkylhydroperoxidase/carboxymuconolactone decarboxylase family protein YurZ